MPIDVEQALGARLPDATGSWTEQDVILYHLGVGAGVPATDERELAYTYEAHLRVLPSFGVLPVFGVLAGLGDLPGLVFDPALLLHGEQDLEIRRTPPTSASIRSTGRVVGVYDKGKAALAVIETETGDDDGPIFVNRFSLFLRGEGGFGGEPGPPVGNVRPGRAPDAVHRSPTLPQQALLYRLCGDTNPLHVDPAYAALGGFERPILHGLCTYGIVCKAVVDTMLDGDTDRVARYQARFAGVVYPGETITTSMWNEDGRILVEASVEERGVAVLTNAACTLR